MPLTTDIEIKPLISDELAEKLGISVYHKDEQMTIYIKDVDIEFGAYKLWMMVTDSKCVSIKVKHTGLNFWHKILRLLYVPDEKFLLTVMGHLTDLRFLFPDIMNIPNKF